jgi:tRNA A37 threonylcarbamoyladenosine modification protein TsaB
MALLRTAVAVRNAELDAIKARFNNCYIRLYTASMPATPETALTGQTLLAELRGNATGTGSAAAGVLTFNAITADASADASGTATWARLLESDGTTVIGDCDVGTTGTAIVLNTNVIQALANVSISSATWTLPM